MTARRRSRYQRLLRWYPAAWRRANGQLMLDTLEQAADAHDRTLPSLREAWSIRAHGLVERATPAAIAVVAGLALALSTVPIGALWTGSFDSSPWSLALTFGTQYGGALAASLAAGALLLRTGIIPAEQALFAAAAAVPAWAFGALMAASWSVGFDEADAGTGLSWFGSASLAFSGLAWIFGILALLPFTLAALRHAGSGAVVWTFGVGIAAAGALALGLMGILPSGAVLMSGLALFIASRRIRSTQRTERIRPNQRAARRPLSPGRRRQLAVVAAASAIIGLGCVAFALTGSLWGIGALDATDTMRIGILFGSVASTITVAASAVALYARVGLPIVGAAAALIGALLLVALSYTLHDDAPAGWTLLVFAGIATGLAGGILLIPLLPRRWWLQTLLVVGIGAAIGTTIGMQGIMMATFISPVVAIVLAVMMARRPRSARLAPDLAPVNAS
ncbi:hypothetical protein ESZ53_11900 [Salinibacterium sp. UTAS2018]|uniref:hypothetical protein n=1 Tax=Salinibacterium sp. UTAS2018 TaxID=2508880 RepID=UPI0010094E8B|nr:hypothetical protein [Salinibacterium sp. UTAS2018]QAV71084.1 hypothetical protein ESZ53_11900 [Salinibacterium sp. UTAS2018]